jgi:hypothetical protein
VFLEERTLAYARQNAPLGLGGSVPDSSPATFKDMVATCGAGFVGGGVAKMGLMGPVANIVVMILKAAVTGTL